MLHISSRVKIIHKRCIIQDPDITYSNSANIIGSILELNNTYAYLDITDRVTEDRSPYLKVPISQLKEL
jgi:hypothetical protein